MKKILLYLMVAFALVSCSDEPQKEYVKLLGTVNLRMTKVYEDGRITGQFYVISYLSETKIELLADGIVVETTKPKQDSAMDIFYLLTQVEKNKEYQLRISLNDSMVELSKPFVVHDTDLKFYSAELFRDDNGYWPGWIESGYYYHLSLMERVSDIMFIIEDSTHKAKLIPNPAFSVFQFEFDLTKESNVSVDVLDILLKPVKKLMENRTLKAGTYTITDQNILPDGLYLIRLKVNNEYSYHGFVQGNKRIVYLDKLR
jgi:hypothetical protein